MLHRASTLAVIALTAGTACDRDEDSATEGAGAQASNAEATGGSNAGGNGASSVNNDGDSSAGMTSGGGVASGAGTGGGASGAGGRDAQPGGRGGAGGAEGGVGPSGAGGAGDGVSGNAGSTPGGAPSTPPTGWLEAEPIDLDHEASFPQVDMDAAGNAIVAWRGLNPVAAWVNRFDAESGTWGTPHELLGDLAYENVPRVAVDPAGNAMVVWDGSAPASESAEARGEVYVSRYDAAAKAWSPVTRMNEEGTRSTAVDVGANPSGNAFAAWIQIDAAGIANEIWASRYVATDGTWGSPELLAADVGSNGFPQVAADGQGNAFVYWHTPVDSSYDVYVSRYSVGDGAWSEAALVGPDQGEDPFAYPYLAADREGNAVAVWTALEGAPLQGVVWANRYDASEVEWGAPERMVADDAGYAADPWVALDGAGNAFVTWQQDDDTFQNVWVRRYAVEQNEWGEPQPIAANSASVGMPRLGADTSGNFLAVWRATTNMVVELYANRYDAETGQWGVAAPIGTDLALFHDIAVNASGRAVVVASRTDLHAWAYRYW